MKIVPMAQLTIGNPIQFTEFVYIAYTEGETILLCVHKAWLHNYMV